MKLKTISKIPENDKIIINSLIKVGILEAQRIPYGQAIYSVLLNLWYKKLITFDEVSILSNYYTTWLYKD